MSQSNYRAKRVQTPSVVIAPVQMFLTVPNGTIVGSLYTVTASWAQILQSLKQGSQVGGPLGSENPANGNGAFGPITGNAYDPALWDFSIAAIVCTTPANVALVGLIMGGGNFELGVGVDAGQASAAIFANSATLSATGRVMSLGTPTPPGQIPLVGDIEMLVKTTALLGANQTVFLTFLFWVTPRKDLT